MQLPPPLVPQRPPPRGRKRSGLAFGYLPQRSTLPPRASPTDRAPGLAKSLPQNTPTANGGASRGAGYSGRRTMTASSSRPASVSRRGRARAQTGNRLGRILGVAALLGPDRQGPGHNRHGGSRHSTRPRAPAKEARNSARNSRQARQTRSRDPTSIAHLTMPPLYQGMPYQIIRRCNTTRLLQLFDVVPDSMLLLNVDAGWGWIMPSDGTGRGVRHKNMNDCGSAFLKGTQMP